jgi:hypothetical protein
MSRLSWRNDQLKMTKTSGKLPIIIVEEFIEFLKETERRWQHVTGWTWRYY